MGEAGKQKPVGHAQVPRTFHVCACWVERAGRVVPGVPQRGLGQADGADGAHAAHHNLQRQQAVAAGRQQRGLEGRQQRQEAVAPGRQQWG